MITAFQGWLQKAPRLYVTGKEAAGFYTPLTDTLSVPLRASCISSWPACRGQSQIPVPEVTHVPLLHWHPIPCNYVLQFRQSDWKASLSCVLSENQETSRAGMDQGYECMHGLRQHWHSHSNAIWVSPFTFFTVTISGHFMRKKRNIKRGTLKATGT